MNRFNCEQENAVFNEISKNQASVSRFNATKTPLKKVESIAKTPLNKSTRKAFGNVSNTIISSVSKSLANSSVKQKSRVKSEVKIKDQLFVKPKSVDEFKNKFLDDIETMDCLKEEELSEMNDPITHNLFGIDDSIVYSMGIDEEFVDQLIAQPISNEDIEEIFGHTITDEEIEDIFGYPITDEDIDEICGNEITDDELTTNDIF